MSIKYCVVDHLAQFDGKYHFDDFRYDKPYCDIPFLHDPREYSGQSTVKLCCTQHAGLTDYEQRKLTNAWVQFFLEKEHPLKRVQFCTSTPQQIFDAVCKQKSIEFLRFKWMRFKDLSAISQLSNLRHLYLGYASSLVDISSLSSLKELEALVFECTTSLTDYAPVGNLRKLKYLSFEEHIAYPTVMGMRSDDFLSNLSELEFLHMPSVRIENRSYLTEESAKKFTYAVFRL